MNYQPRQMARSVWRLSPALLTALTGASLLAVSGTAYSVVVEEITVTTRRAEENLQEIPVAVTALSADFIEKKGITTTADVAALVPGVQFDQSFSAADTRISIRGINSERGRASAAVLVDGIDVSGENVTAGGGSSLLNTRLLELERVEVIKGPQSALYGRNAFAGAINYITKQPSMDEFEATATLSASSYKSRGHTTDLRGRVSLPLIDDTLAISLNVGAFEDTGAYKNNNPVSPDANVPLNGSESIGARLVALWTPGDATEVTAALSYSDTETDPRAVVKVGNANTFYLDGAVLPGVTMGDFTFNGAQDYGQWLGTVRDSDVSRDAVNLSLSQRNNGPFEGSDDENLMASLRVVHDFESTTFKSVTAYIDNDASLNEDAEYQDGIGTTFMGVGLSLDNDYLDMTETKIFKQEFTLESSDWEHGNWLVGVSYFDENVDNSDMSLGWYNDPFTAFVPGFCGTAPFQVTCSFAESAAAAATPKTTERDTQSYSVFGLIGFDLTERLSVTAEARYIKDEIEVTTNTAIDRVSQYVLNVPIDLAGIAPTPVELPTSDDQDSDTINPRIAVDFALNDDVLLYASAAKGTKPAGFGTAQFARPQAAKIDQEKLYAYEIGAKTTWLDGTLNANGAIYYNDYQDRQVGVTVTDPVTFWPASGIVNAAEAETKGFEVDLTWAPTEQLTLAAAYAYTDAEWTDFDYAEIRAKAGGSVTDKDRAICADANGDCSGAEIAGIPENALTLLLNYRMPLTGVDAEAFFNIIGSYTDERAVYDRVETAFLDDYWNWDLQAGFETDQLTGQLYINNLLDDETPRWAQGYNDFRDGMYGGGFGGEPRDETVFAFLPPPREVGVRVTYRFE